MTYSALENHLRETMTSVMITARSNWGDSIITNRDLKAEQEAETARCRSLLDKFNDIEEEHRVA